LLPASVGGVALPEMAETIPNTLLLLDQLGGIWEIIFWMALPELLPTGFKRSL
jgi:hypothetical protein